MEFCLKCFVVACWPNTILHNPYYIESWSLFVLGFFAGTYFRFFHNYSYRSSSHFRPKLWAYCTQKSVLLRGVVRNRNIFQFYLSRFLHTFIFMRKLYIVQRVQVTSTLTTLFIISMVTDVFESSIAPVSMVPYG